jgi:replicative DNA helicase
MASERKSVPRGVSGVEPPNDHRAEAAILSAMLLHRPSLDIGLEILSPDQFYSDAHRRVFASMQSLAVAGSSVDIVSVASHLRSTDQLQRIGGASALAELSDATPSVGNLPTHIAIVLEKSRLRKFIAACQRLAAEGYGDCGPVEEFIASGASEIGSIAISADRSTAVSMPDALAQGAADLELRAETGITGIPFGFAALDSATAGMHRRDVILVGGPTGRGKSSFAGSVALGTATAGIGVLWIGLDNMPPGENANRIASARARVDLMAFKTGRADPAQWARFTAAQNEVSRLPIVFECHRNMTAMQARSKIRAARERVNLGLVVIDYFQKLQPEPGASKSSRDDTRERELRRSSDLIQETAHMFELPILMLCQEHTFQGSEPAVKDCRAAGENAQVRLSISWKETERRAGPVCLRAPAGYPAIIRVVKGRGAKLGPTDTFFYPQWTLFSDEAP